MFVTSLFAVAPCETANLDSHKFTANMEFKANKRSLLYATTPPVVQLLKMLKIILNLLRLD
jgi:hypothetical protein